MSVITKTSRNESVAAVQAKSKAFKEQQRARLDSRHYYMFEIIGERLQLDSNTVEEFMLDGDQVSSCSCPLTLIILILYS